MEKPSKTTKVMDINQKLSIMQTKFKSKKSRFNNFGKYNFRSAEDILEAIKPFLLELDVTVTINETFFQGHFPGFPVMPGVLIVEAMAQIGGILVLNTFENPEDYLTFFAKIDKVKFKNKVFPGDTIIFKCTLISPIRRGICHMQGYAYANGKLCAEAELIAQILSLIHI